MGWIAVGLAVSKLQGRTERRPLPSLPVSPFPPPDGRKRRRRRWSALLLFHRSNRSTVGVVSLFDSWNKRAYAFCRVQKRIGDAYNAIVEEAQPDIARVYPKLPSSQGQNRGLASSPLVSSWTWLPSCEFPIEEEHLLSYIPSNHRLTASFYSFSGTANALLFSSPYSPLRHRSSSSSCVILTTSASTYVIPIAEISTL